MTAEHNHPPRCCCSTRDVIDGLDGKWHQTGEDDAHPVAQCEAPWCGRICPACPEHGQLAQAVECPQCHQPAGRPHTDYCPRIIRDTTTGTNCQLCNDTDNHHITEHTRIYHPDIWNQIDKHPDGTPHVTLEP